MLIREVLQRKKSSEKIAIHYGEEKINYKDLYLKAEAFSNNIYRNIKHLNYNIGLFLPNSIHYAEAYFAITFLDRVIVPIGIQAKSPEICSSIEYCELNLIITDSQHEPILEEAIKKQRYQVFILNIETGKFNCLNKESMQVNSSANMFDDGENGVAIMLHTSGTTSNPKRVMLTHKNLVENIKSNIASLQLTEADKVLIALPMFFGYCNTAQFLTHLYLGATLVILKEMFTPKLFFKTVDAEHITNFTAVPSSLLMLLSYRHYKKYDMSSLRYICFGGGNMPVKKLKEISEMLPTVGFVQTYGQTEAGPRLTALLPIDAMTKIGSVGKPIPGVSINIINDSDEKNGYPVGEIIAAGPNIMKGYYKQKEMTENTIIDGWLQTGDLGYFDDEGYLYLTGRKKNLIISGGINIYPEEVEEILLSHPMVKEVRVSGKPHNILGAVPFAEVVAHDDISICEETLKTYCFDNLSEFKVPKEIKFIETFPKTATGKVQRFA